MFIALNSPKQRDAQQAGARAYAFIHLQTLKETNRGTISILILTGCSVFSHSNCERIDAEKLFAFAIQNLNEIMCNATDASRTHIRSHWQCAHA